MHPHLARSTPVQAHIHPTLDQPQNSPVIGYYADSMMDIFEFTVKHRNQICRMVEFIMPSKWVEYTVTTGIEADQAVLVARACTMDMKE